MVRCAVPSCRSNNGVSRGVSFYNFPKDPGRKALWIHLTGTKVKLNHARVCSNHFTEADLDLSYFIKKSLMPGASVKHILRADAVPSIDLHSPTSSKPSPKSRKKTNSNNSRTERQQRKERKELVEQLLADYDKELETARSAVPDEPQEQEVIELVQRKNRILRLPKQDNTTPATSAAASYVDSSSLEVPAEAQEIELTEPEQNTTILSSVPSWDNATVALDAAASSEEVPVEPQDVEAIEPEQKIRIRSVPKRDSGTVVAGAATLSEKKKRRIRSVPKRDNATVAAVAATLSEPDKNKPRIRSVPKRDNATVAAEAAASYADSVGMAVTVAGLVTGENVGSVAAAAAAPTGGLSDDDGPSFEDDGAASDGASDDDGSATAPLKDVPNEALKNVSQNYLNDDQRVSPSVIAPRVVPNVDPTIATNIALGIPSNAGAITLVSVVPSEISPEKKLGDAPSFCTRRTYRRSNLMVERAKEILRLKVRVRKLEDKCLLVLSVPSSQLLVPNGEKKAAEMAEQRDGAEVAPAETAPAATATGETPLMVLRDDRGSKLPTILTKMQQYQLSDSVAMFMPSDLQEAQDVNHRLKVQFLNLQATMLKWAIKNKKLRDDTQKEAEQKKEKSKKMVHGTRLRELLRLEAAVKAMFTDTQIRAITRDHGGSSGGALPAKRKGGPHWGDEDLRCVLELRAISSDKVVEHVRQRMKIPLPSMAATKQRCKKSPDLNKAFKAMLAKSEENQKRCDVCERQLNTIDDVIEAAAEEQLHEGHSTFGRQFVQHVPRHSEDAAVPRPRKRRRAPAAPVPLARKKVRQMAAASLDWADTSDSDAELSDPGIWGRLAPSDTDWQPDQLISDTPPRRKQPQPDPVMQMKKAWR